MNHHYVEKKNLGFIMTAVYTMKALFNVSENKKKIYPVLKGI